MQKSVAGAQHKAYMKQRQKTAQGLMERLKALYQKIENDPNFINEAQRVAKAKLEVEFATKQRELAQKYMQKEIDIILDLKGEYRKSGLVDPAGNIIKK